MRKIDADELIKTIEKVCFSPEWARFRVDFGSNGERDYIINEIVNAPTIEITEEQAIDKLHETGWMQRHDKEMTERPTGEWMLHGMIYYCSECGHECGESGDNFCGNCGAKMKKGEEEE